MIVDVLAVQRQFLRDQPEKVKALLEAYARCAYAHARQPDGMLKLVREDAQKTGAESLGESQARKVVDGIQWKNTLENYAHFGLASGADHGGLQTLEDMIGRIVDVLIKTKALPSDPLGGNYSSLYYDKILADMKQARFHPGQGKALVPGLGVGEANPETVHGDAELAVLTPDQWNSLRPVGELKIAPIEFGRASAEITLDGERELQALAKRLQTFPRYYLRVIGHARAEGDPEANRMLAQARAEAAAQFLTAQGLSPSRVQADIAAQSTRDAAAQSVSFVVGQMPY
jgi:outer membrane protein OmpA-like peptidoglycan-associated protein